MMSQIWDKTLHNGYEICKITTLGTCTAVMWFPLNINIIWYTKSAQDSTYLQSWKVNEVCISQWKPAEGPHIWRLLWHFGCKDEILFLGFAYCKGVRLLRVCWGNPAVVTDASVGCVDKYAPSDAGQYSNPQIHRAKHKCTFISVFAIFIWCIFTASRE